MSFNNQTIKRKNTFPEPEAQLYKVGELHDKELGITSPINKSIRRCYQKCLSIPIDLSVDPIPMHTIFKNEESIIWFYTQIIEYQGRSLSRNLHEHELLCKSASRILQITEEKFGTKGKKYLLNLRNKISKKYEFHPSPMFSCPQSLVNTQFRIVKNGIWDVCTGAELFKSEESFGNYTKSLYEYGQRNPEAQEMVEKALTFMMNQLGRVIN